MPDPQQPARVVLTDRDAVEATTAQVVGGPCDGLPMLRLVLGGGLELCMPVPVVVHLSRVLLEYLDLAVCGAEAAGEDAGPEF